MKTVIIISVIIAFINFTSCAQSSSKPSTQKNTSQHVGGTCEGCEAIYESPVPFNKLSWVDTLPDFNEPGPKMVISGIIYEADQKTPARDVVLYVYHTDQTGQYTRKGNETGWGRRHGYIRGWMKTNEKGEYKFYTLKPAPYPGRNIPMHIHPVIKEVDKNDYFIDEFLFDDDPILTPDDRRRMELRGGNGIVRLQNKNGILVGKRDIILGYRIPGYPSSTKF